jgi:putative transposase
MQRSKAEVYLHFVWATKRRLPLITPEVERGVYRSIASESQRLGCVVLGIGGMPDHVHLVLKTTTTLSPARIMQYVKGGSSRYVQERLPQAAFGWQENYGVFSVTRSHLARVLAYVHGQKEHHASGELWPEWEDAWETIGDVSPSNHIP